MKKKSLSAKKKIHKKLLINLKKPLINKIYKDFNNFVKFNLNKSNFSVAVSGGTDSLALAYLAKCYSIKKNVKLFFYHVDHGLRNESSIEASQLKRQMAYYDIKIKFDIFF